MNLFSMTLGIGYKIKRKDSEGNVVKWERRNGRLRIQMLPSSYIDKELKTADTLNRMMSQFGGLKI